MKVKRFEVNLHDYDRFWEEDINALLKGAVHVHTVQAPYNNREPMLIYAFYPDDYKNENISFYGVDEFFMKSNK